MHAWESIQTAVDYIENHLSEDIDIELLAKKAALSPFYFQRLFAKLVGKPVKEYVRLRRLARAADALAKNDNRILDVALEYGYESHQGFTRAFKEAYNITPEDYRSNPAWRSDFQKPDLSLKYKLVDENVPLVAEGVVLEVQRRTLEEAETDTGIDPLGELWTRFHKEKHAIPNAIPGGHEIGVSMMSTEEGKFKYFAGLQTTAAKTQSPYDQWTLQAGEYIACSFEAENFEKMVTSALDKALGYLFGTWLPNHGLATQPYSAERYNTPANTSTTLEIWVSPRPL